MKHDDKVKIHAGLTRIANVIELSRTSLDFGEGKYTEQYLTDMLKLTWELCRDVNPDIIIRAGSAITPPDRTPVQIIEKDRLQ